MKLLLDLTNTEMVQSQFTVARQFWQTFCTGQNEKITLVKLLSNYSMKLDLRVMDYRLETSELKVFKASY